MTFNEVRNMTDKELAQWLEKIWKTGYTIGNIGGKITDVPNFYERLSK